MSLRVDDFFRPSKNKHSSQYIHKRFKNRHRKSKEPKPEPDTSRISTRRRGVAKEIESRVQDYSSSSDEEMTEHFGETQPDWTCETCTFINTGACSQCIACASSRHQKATRSSTNRITLGDFLSRPQAMDLDDIANNSNPFLQSAIHMSFQDIPQPIFGGTSVTTTTTTTTYRPAVVTPSPFAPNFSLPMSSGFDSQPRNRRRGKRKRTNNGFNQYWEDAQENNIFLPAHQHYERNPDDFGRSFEPIGSRESFGLKFGVPRAIGDSRRSGNTFIGGKSQNPKKCAREERKAKKLYEFYRHIYVGNGPREKLEIARIIKTLISYVPSDLRQRKQFDGKGFDVCQACYAVDFRETYEDVGPVVLPHCGHQTLCSDCFGEYLRIRIRDEDIVPWLPCPMPDCKTCVPADFVVAYLSLEDMYKFASTFLRQHLKRNSNWVSCEGDRCEFGFVYNENCDDDGATCEACGHEQSFTKGAQDDGFAELIANGTMRLCPKCEWPTMKDYGMCNVMQCGQCGIWWNWRTRDCGNSSAEVKQRARYSGTMWEPGELEYQWDLQRTNLPAFKELLARNGIKYNPNYVRGSG